MSTCRFAVRRPAYSSRAADASIRRDQSALEFNKFVRRCRNLLRRSSVRLTALPVRYSCVSKKIIFDDMRVKNAADFFAEKSIPCGFRAQGFLIPGKIRRERQES